MKSRFSEVLVCIAAAVVLSVFCGAFLPINEKNIYDSVIRLHVIANSDDAEDQAVKLAVRDAVLDEAGRIFEGADYNSAADIAVQQLDTLKAVAERVIERAGADYSCTVTLAEEEFPTRDYGDAVLPGGDYLSLCIRLGDADGKNWWCVMFPPMCNGAARSIKAVQNCGDTDIFVKPKKPRFVFKLFLLELFN